MKISYLILVSSLMIGIALDYLYRAVFTFWFVPVMTSMLAMFVVLGFRGWSEHWWKESAKRSVLRARTMYFKENGISV